MPTAATVRTAGRVTTTRNMVSGVCARRASRESTASWNVSKDPTLIIFEKNGETSE